MDCLHQLVLAYLNLSHYTKAEACGRDSHHSIWRVHFFGGINFTNLGINFSLLLLLSLLLLPSLLVFAFAFAAFALLLRLLLLLLLLSAHLVFSCFWVAFVFLFVFASISQ